MWRTCRCVRLPFWPSRPPAWTCCRTGDSSSGSALLSASAQVLTTLMTVGVPVLEFRLEGGRLSDAFLAVTAEEAPV